MSFKEKSGIFEQFWPNIRPFARLQNRKFPGPCQVGRGRRGDPPPVSGGGVPSQGFPYILAPPPPPPVLMIPGPNIPEELCRWVLAPLGPRRCQTMSSGPSDRLIPLSPPPAMTLAGFPFPGVP